MAENLNFHGRLKELIDSYVHNVYDISRKFPREELFGLTSQLKRAAVSIALNYTEGYARKRPAVLKNFFETSYGSLKESRYLVNFASQRSWISEKECQYSEKLASEIGAMLWSTISRIK